jgi:hypothetical protein
MNIDLIIQGPVHGNNAFLSKMDNLCKQFNKVIISTWDHEDSAAWVEKLSGYNNVVITSQKLPDRPGLKGPYRGIATGSTFYWACLSTYNGLKESSAEYVVKMRSDEYYEDFTAFKLELKKANHKFVCGNIFYKRWYRSSPYHIGDHVYACKREGLQNGLKMVLDYYNHVEWHKEIEYKEDISQDLTCAEIVLAHTFLIGSGIPRIEWFAVGATLQTAPAFDKYFKVIDINKLGEYVARWEGSNITFRHDTSPFIHSHYDR